MRKCSGLGKVTKMLTSFKINNENTRVMSILFPEVLLVDKGWSRSDVTSSHALFVFAFSSDTFFHVLIFECLSNLQIKQSNYISFVLVSLVWLNQMSF